MKPFSTSFSLISSSDLRPKFRSASSSSSFFWSSWPTAWISFAFRQLNEIQTVGQLLQKKRSEEHTSELQSHLNLVCPLLLEKKTRPLQTTIGPRPRTRTLMQSLATSRFDPCDSCHAVWLSCPDPYRRHARLCPSARWPSR